MTRSPTDKPPMRFTKFEISNFKGVEKLTLDLTRPPTTNVITLVGLNESGKTTILEALSWFANPESLDPYELIPKVFRANFNGEIFVQATVELSNDDKQVIIRFLENQGMKVDRQTVNDFTVKRSYFYSNSQKEKDQNIWGLLPYVKQGNGRKFNQLRGKDKAWQDLIKMIRSDLLPPVIFYQNFLFDFPDEIYLTPVADPLEDEQNTYRNALQDVLDSLGIGVNIKDHLIDRFMRGTTNDLDGLQAVLDQASAKITEVVISAWRDIVKQPVPDLSITLGHGIHTNDKGLFLRLKVKEGSQTYYIRERSLGFRWFLGFILFTHFRTYRNNQPRNALFVLDEPASNLHPAAQEKILSVFSKFPRNQTVIYSTHSHNMIDPQWLAGTFIVSNHGRKYDGLDLSFTSSMTKIQAERYYNYVSANPHDFDLYRPILDALDYRPSLLEMVPSIVIVEGKNDYFTLRYVAEILKLGAAQHFYPSTGKDKTEYVVALYLAWGRNFIVLLDADKGGIETSNRLLRSYGEVVSDSVFTLGSIDKAWVGFALEDLFESEDRMRIQQLVFPDKTSYSKSAFNTALQAAFASNQSVILSEPAHTRFTKLLNFLADTFERAR